MLRPFNGSPVITVFTSPRVKYKFHRSAGLVFHVNEVISGDDIGW
jgi:hypothetical protein